MTCKGNIAAYDKRTLPHGIRVDVQGLLNWLYNAAYGVFNLLLFA